MSTLYYALFHTLAQSCADLMVGGKNSERSNPAWRQVYRALEHGHTKAQCLNNKVVSKFPKEIEDFANMFVAMQIKRHAADYDPFYAVTKSEVQADCAAVRDAIKKFRTTPTKDRRAFAAYVLFKTRL